MNEKMIIQPNWDVPPNIRAFTTTISGGVSTGNYQELNLATHVGDNPEKVTENRRRLQQYLGQSVELCWLQQTHSDSVVNLSHYQNSVEADASVSRCSGKACVVMTADCLPVLLCNHSGSQVAALHCGWQGLYQNLIAKTIQQYFPNEAITAWLGPAIAQQSYEVDEKLYQLFVAANPNYQQAFLATKPGHYLFDLYHIAKQQLAALGVSKTVYGGNFDTFTDSRFYSYRQNAQTGRMATIIYRI